MKRLFLLLIMICVVLGGYAQLLVKGNYSTLSGEAGVNSVILFSTIDNSSEIHYKTASPSVIVRWFSYENGKKTEIRNYSVISSTQTYIDPRANKGYIVSANGEETVVWVLDKSLTKPNEPLVYENPTGNKLTLSQTPQIRVNNQKQSFKIYDEEPPEVEDPDSIDCKITAIVSVRDALNENKRPTDKEKLEGSAPLHVEFFSNATGVVKNYVWQLYKDGELFLTRTDVNHQYTFNETGKYVVKLEVTNDTNSATDSKEVIVSESSIMAPKVFTPNGDGFNDEFRVAYTSIVEYDCTILNRWGRVVYRSTNPQTGWDGKINGKPAAEGTYFYVIKAKGSDDKPYVLKGHTNLLR